ncbi:hypothetical protein Q9966_012618 [Columba livia]|nr:hypothetical protein Q9966_012618 [Columba livia]
MGGTTHKPHPPLCCRALTCTPAARVPRGGFKRGEGRGQDGGKGRSLRARVIFSVGERRVPTDTQKAWRSDVGARHVIEAASCRPCWCSALTCRESL